MGLEGTSSAVNCPAGNTPNNRCVAVGLGLTHAARGARRRGKSVRRSLLSAATRDAAACLVGGFLPVRIVFEDE